MTMAVIIPVVNLKFPSGGNSAGKGGGKAVQLDRGDAFNQISLNKLLATLLFNLATSLPELLSNHEFH